MSAVILVMAQITIPLPFTPVPMSLASLAVILAGTILGPTDGTIAVVIYILLGIVGLPAFAGFTRGFTTLLGPTGGFIMGYPILAFLAGYLSSLFKKKIKLFTTYMLAVSIATIPFYTLGCMWYLFYSKTTVAVSITVSIVPFIPSDIIKNILASIIMMRYTRITKDKEK